jgi:hypothetical protein
MLWGSGCVVTNSEATPFWSYFLVGGQPPGGGTICRPSHAYLEHSLSALAICTRENPRTYETLCLYLASLREKG